MDDPIRNYLDAIARASEDVVRASARPWWVDAVGAVGAIAVGSFAFLRLEQRLHLADVSASGRERIDLP